MERNPVVTIELDRVRELRCSHRSLKRWSAHTKKSIADLDTDALDPEGLETLLYFLMEKDAQEHGEDLKLSDMEELLDNAPLGLIYKKLGEAVEAAFPEANGKNAARAVTGTGRMP